MLVEVWSDIVCPWCYIGKRRFERALERFEQRDEVEVVWRSFELDPRAPRTLDTGLTEMLASKYGVSHAQAAAMNARVTEEARKEGLDYRLDIARPGNTFDAHRLTHLAATVGLRAEAVERFMHAYFVEGAEIGDGETLVRLVAEAGVDAGSARAALAGDAFAAEVRADETRARALGVSGVPFFAFDERFGVSGAQPVEVLLGALREARENEGQPAAGD
jgi:predicted DsbA family dithiol-disulfide isomerase